MRFPAAVVLCGAVGCLLVFHMLFFVLCYPRHNCCTQTHQKKAVTAATVYIGSSHSGTDTASRLQLLLLLLLLLSLQAATTASTAAAAAA
jgi:hypothetical protein